MDDDSFDERLIRRDPAAIQFVRAARGYCALVGMVNGETHAETIRRMHERLLTAYEALIEAAADQDDA